MMKFLAFLKLRHFLKNRLIATVGVASFLAFFALLPAFSTYHNFGHFSENLAKFDGFLAKNDENSQKNVVFDENSAKNQLFSQNPEKNDVGKDNAPLNHSPFSCATCIFSNFLHDFAIFLPFFGVFLAFLTVFWCFRVFDFSSFFFLNSSAPRAPPVFS